MVGRARLHRRQAFRVPRRAQRLCFGAFVPARGRKVAHVAVFDQPGGRRSSPRCVARTFRRPARGLYCRLRRTLREPHRASCSRWIRARSSDAREIRECLLGSRAPSMGRACSGPKRPREGLFVLSRLLMASLYPADRRRGEKLLVESAQLGSVSAMMERALCVGSEDPERYRWWGRVTARGEHCAVANLCRAVERMNRRPRGPVMYAIGSAWEGHLNVESCSAFGATMSSDTIQSLVGAVKYFVACNRKARAAIRCWIVIARRHGVVKDMRTTIARMVWKDRAAWSKRTI